jgi:DNA (cytosine-5)-methyltransferase 1
MGVIGGAPCQSFSPANVHQRRRDKRHVLPSHYARIVEGLHLAFGLDFFLFENVPGLASMKHRRKLARLKARLARAGFTVTEGVIDAQNFGVPQVRPRLFVVGINKIKYPGTQFVLPRASRARRRVVRDAIGRLPEPIYFRRGLRPEEIPFHPNHWCMVPRSVKLLSRSLTTSWRERRSFKVLDWSRPSVTVAYGHREVHIHPRRHRRLSVYEAMLLQGFPKDYVLLGNLTDQVRLVSEAVPPAVGHALARALRQQLSLG